MLHDASVSLGQISRKKGQGENLWDTYKYSRDKVVVFSGGPGLWASWWSLRAVLLGDFCGSSGFLVGFSDVFPTFQSFFIGFSSTFYAMLSQVSLKP